MSSVNPDILVSTAWVAEHLDTPGLRLVEVDLLLQDPTR
jgi:hypothetical protein